MTSKKALQKLIEKKDLTREEMRLAREINDDLTTLELIKNILDESAGRNDSDTLDKIFDVMRRYDI